MTTLMTIGVYSLLAALLVILAPLLLDALFSKGQRDPTMAFRIAQYPFYFSSLLFLGYLFADDLEKEIVTDDGMGITLLIISAIALCCMICKIVSFSIRTVKKRNLDKQEQLRIEKVSRIRSDLSVLRNQKQRLETEFCSYKTILHLFALFELCGDATTFMQQHPNIKQAQRIQQNISATNKAIADLENQLLLLNK